MQLGRPGHAHLDARFDLIIRLGVAVWGLGFALGHGLGPPPALWWVAAVFSVLMNLTYPLAAWRAGHGSAFELVVSGALIGMSLLGPTVHPLFLIVAVALHGLYDGAKHLGVGVPFFRWYTAGCLVIDVPWAAFLFWIWWRLQ